MGASIPTGPLKNLKRSSGMPIDGTYQALRGDLSGIVGVRSSDGVGRTAAPLAAVVPLPLVHGIGSKGQQSFRHTFQINGGTNASFSLEGLVGGQVNASST